MLVIGGLELRFRVNVRPTNRDVGQEKYGLFRDLSAMPPARARTGMRASLFEFCGMKFRPLEGRAGSMANRIFPRLPCRPRFESMPAAATSKTHHSRGR